jgi:hypothetical protein
MHDTQVRKINVTALFAAFKTYGVVRRITPLNFTLLTGEEYEVAVVRRSYADRVGNSQHVHFVVQTKDHRYFDIVFDSQKMTWWLVIEIEDPMIFRE